MMNKEMAIAKMINLQSALAECGIESEITEWENTTESGSTTKFVSLRAELWNCVHDGDVVFEVYAEDTDDYEEISVTGCAAWNNGSDDDSGKQSGIMGPYLSDVMSCVMGWLHSL
jgi:hypothetical protein